jgi:hypothetical protein
MLQPTNEKAEIRASTVGVVKGSKRGGYRGLRVQYQSDAVGRGIPITWRETHTETTLPWFD